MSTDRQIVPGISLDPSGQAIVDPAVADVLFDLAIKLEEPTDLPVDVEHVLAAVVLAARNAQLDDKTPLASDDMSLVEILAPHVTRIFKQYGGKVGSDD